MADDLNTVNYSREKVAREFDALRTRYREQRDTLRRLADEAPTDVLSSRYRQLISEIEAAISKIDELEQVGGQPPRGNTPAGPAAPARTARGVVPVGATESAAGSKEEDWDQIRRTAPGNRAAPPVAPSAVDDDTRRTLIMVGAGMLLLILTGFLLWKFAFGWAGKEDNTITEIAAPTSTAVTDSAEVAKDDPPAVRPAISVEPSVQDFGDVRKGTRSMKNFVLQNNGSSPLTVKVERSTCRCLWFDYPATVAPGAKANFTVAVDGGRAKPGALTEEIEISAATGNDPPALLTIRANVK